MSTRRHLELALRIKGDMDALLRDLAAVNKALEDVRAAESAANAGLSQASAGANTAATALDAVDQTGDAASGALNRTGAAGAAAATGLQKTGAVGSGSASAGLTQTAGTAGKATSALESTEQKAEEAAEALSRTGTAGSTAASGLDKVGTAGASASAGLGQTTKAAQSEAAAIAASNARRERLVQLLATSRGQRVLEAEATRAASGAYGAGSTALDGMAISAGQTQAAFRMLPAQITDVTTSLASGMPVWLVAIQQGGQIKDSFGGIGPAFTAITSRITPMMVGLGAAAAVIGGVAYAAVSAYTELRAYDRAIIATGQSSGATTSQLAALSDEVGRSTGAYGDAETAVTMLASNGRIAADVLGTASAAAVALAEVTGMSIEDATDKVIDLAKAPTKTLRELNDAYNFLEPEIYAQVRALEAQGRAQDAATLAIETFADVHEERVREAREAAGFLERAWDAVGRKISEVWNDIKGIGRDTTGTRVAEAQTDLYTRMAMRQKLIDSGATDSITVSRIEQLEGQILVAQDRYVAAQREALKEREAADQKATEAEERRAAIAAQHRAESIADQDKVIGKKRAEEQLERDIAALRKAGMTEVEGMSIEQYESIARKRIEDQFKERAGSTPSRTEEQRTEQAGKRELEQLRERVAMLAEVDDQERRASETARIRYEINEGSLKLASESLKTELEAAAKAVDLEQTRVEVARELVAARLRIISLQGEDAQLIETTRELERLRGELVEVGDAAGAADVSKLMGLEKAASDARTAGESIEREFARISRAEERINISRQNGLISSVTAQEHLLALRQEEIAAIEASIPAMEAAAAAMDAGSLAQQRLHADIEGLKNQLYDLQTQGTLLETTFRGAFESGLGDAMYGLATQTMSLREAAVGMLTDITSAMARLAAQQLASAITAKAMKAVFGDKGGTADVGEGASKLQTAAITTGLAGGVIMTGANQLSNSAKELAQAATLMIIANSMSGFAGGGYTGDGGRYQVAGFVHRGEGVLNQDEIAALGGPSGFYALRSAIKNGTLPDMAPAAPAAMASPRYGFSDGGMALEAMPATQNNMSLYLYQDIDALRGAILNHPSTEKYVVEKVGENGNAVQAAW